MIRPFLRSPYDGAIYRLAIPALGALAVDPLVSLVDTAFVGHLGAAPLAGVAIASAVFAVVFAMFNFLEYAVTPLIAHALGAGDRDGAGHLAVGALAVAVVAGAAAAVILAVGGEAFLGVFGAEDEVLDLAATYLGIRALGLPAMLILMVGHGAFRGYQDTRTPLVVTVGFSLVNLVLDPLLIFGLDWGVAGAAWATVIAQAFGAVWFLVLFFGTRRVELAIRLERPRTQAVGALLSAGKILVLRNVSLLFALTATTAVAARLGTAQVAAHQVGLQVWIFLALVVDALAIAGQALIGTSLGSGDGGTARTISDRLLGLGLITGVALSLALVAVAPWLGSVFTDDRAVLAAFAIVYPFLVIMQPLNALVFVWDGIAIGATAFRFLAMSTFAAAVAAVVVLLPVIPLGWGLAGVWSAIVALMLVRAASLWWWFGHAGPGIGRGPYPSSPAT